MRPSYFVQLFILSFVVTTVVSQNPNTSHGGGSCATDWDCSLGGTCTANKCTCDVWFTGPQCSLLNLQPAESNYGLQVPNYHSWGGHALRNPSDGLYHGFFSFMCNHSTLDDWTTKSSIWRAVSKSPAGPFAMAEMVAQPWSHNAMIAYHNVTQSYHLWQIGNAVTPSSLWAPCYTPSQSESSSPATKHAHQPFVNPKNIMAKRNGTVLTDQIYLRTSRQLTGPWSDYNNNHGIKLDIGTSWVTNGANGGNPAPYYFENGTVLLYFTANPCPSFWPHLAPNCIAVARANHWNDTYHVLDALPITAPESEDPFVFRDPRGNFHMLTNVNTYHARCGSGVPCGGHAWSRDGLSWSNLTIGAFGPVIRFSNGSYWRTAYVERPQVLQDAKGVPVAFYVGVGRASYEDSASWAQYFCVPGKTDCGPTTSP